MPNVACTAQEEIDMQNETARLYAEHRSSRKVAELLGIGASSVLRHVRAVERRGGMIDRAMQDAMDAVGAQYEPGVAWIKKKLGKGEGGTEFSVMVTRRKPIEEDAEDTISRLDELFRSVPPANLPPLVTTRDPASSRFALIPINDLHVGMYAWGDETGSGDWDTEIATARLVDWVGQLLATIPGDVGELVMLYNGDILHANDHTGMTPKNKHILDMDTRFLRTVDKTALAIITAADLAAQVFPRVRIVIRPGNHDTTAYVSLLMGVKWRYYQTPNVTVDASPGEFWAYRRGSTFLFSHHGDKAKPEQLVLAMASQFPEDWGASRHRYVWTGDKHHRASKRIGGAMWEQASAMTERDAYAANGAYTNSPELQAIIYSDARGEVARLRVAAS